MKELAAYKPPAGYDHKGDLTEDGAARLGIDIDMKDKLKAKRRKDPNAPKKNLSSYLLYQNHLRQTSLAKENPISFGDIAKHASESFKKMSSEERRYWDQKALDDKNRYDNEMKDYKPPFGFDQKGFAVESVDAINSNDDKDRKMSSAEAGKACADINSIEPNAKPDAGTDHVKVVPKKKKRKKKLPRDEDLPKRSAGAYVFFTNEFRPTIWKENPDLKFVEIGRILGERWRALTPKEKEPYEEKATLDKARYQKEMQAYKKRKGEELEQMRTHETQQFQAPNDANLEQVQVQAQVQGSKQASQLQSPSSVAKGGSSEYNYEYDYNQPMQSAPHAFPSHYNGYTVNNPGYSYYNDRGAH